MDTLHAVVTEALEKTFRSGFLRRRAHPALRGLSLEIPAGCVTALLGPNGSGKTTLMRILVGLLRPTGGKASVLGQPPGAPEALRRIGFLAESPGLLPNLTGAENLTAAAKLRGVPAAIRTERVEALLSRFDLEGDAARRVSQYSTGMLKRVALCQALVHDPDLLILDEPASGLDPASSAMVEELVRERCTAGRTVLLSSHLLGRVETVADRVCIVDRGTLAASGTLQEVAGVPGSFEIRAGGGSPEEAKGALEAAGFAVEFSRPARDPLEEVFIRLTTPGKGGSKG